MTSSKTLGKKKALRALGYCRAIPRDDGQPFRRLIGFKKYE